MIKKIVFCTLAFSFGFGHQYYQMHHGAGYKKINPHRKVDLPFKKYVEWVKFLARENRVPKRYIENIDLITFNFVKEYTDKPSVVGRCRWSLQLNKFEVTFKKLSWELFDDSFRESLFLHELGHCWKPAMLRHDPTLINGEPASVMHPFISPNHKKWDLMSEYYINEFFNKVLANGIRHERLGIKTTSGQHDFPSQNHEPH